MKYTSLLLAIALVATITPQVSATTTASTPAQHHAPPDLVTPDYDLGLQIAAAPDLDLATMQLYRLTSGDDAPAAVFAILKPEDALAAPQPPLTAILTRRQLSRLHCADWQHITRVADPTAA